MGSLLTYLWSGMTPLSWLKAFETTKYRSYSFQLCPNDPHLSIWWFSNPTWKNNDPQIGPSSPILGVNIKQKSFKPPLTDYIDYIDSQTDWILWVGPSYLKFTTLPTSHVWELSFANHLLGFACSMLTLPETNTSPMKIPIFPGKYQFSMAMLVYRRVNQVKTILPNGGFLLVMNPMVHGKFSQSPSTHPKLQASFLGFVRF